MDLLFFSSDEKHAQRVSLRLRQIAHVRWQDSRRFPFHESLPRHDGTMLVLLDYASGQTETSTSLARQLLERTPGVRLLGVGSTGDDHAAGVLAALRAGVLDFIDLDADDHEIRALLEHAAQRQPATPPAPMPEPEPHGRGQLVILLGARAGVGTSTLAAHLATLAIPPDNRNTAAARALLLDLGHPYGDGSLYLGVSGNFHYTDALHQAERIDATFARTALPRHAGGLTVLSQTPADTSPAADMIDASPLLNRLRGIFDLLLCDLGGIPCRQWPAAMLRAADEIWLVTDQGIGSMVSLDTCLQELARAKARDQRLSLVVNRYLDDSGAEPARIAERFGLPLLASLPERRTLRSSASQGLLLQQDMPHDPYIRALQPLLARLRIAPTHAPGFHWKRLLNFSRGSR